MTPKQAIPQVVPFMQESPCRFIPKALKLGHSLSHQQALESHDSPPHVGLTSFLFFRLWVFNFSHIQNKTHKRQTNKNRAEIHSDVGFQFSTPPRHVFFLFFNGRRWPGSWPGSRWPAAALPRRSPGLARDEFDSPIGRRGEGWANRFLKKLSFQVPPHGCHVSWEGG